MNNVDRLNEVLNATLRGMPASYDRVSFIAMADDDLVAGIRSGKVIPLGRERVRSIGADLRRQLATLKAVTALEPFINNPSAWPD